MRYFNKILLVVIFLTAIFLRFYQLGINPPSLTWDEAAWGYNAYSLGIDGKDEFGRLLPYDYLESFGDFKPPMYAYLAVIPVKIFGLNEFAVRFPSAFFGSLTVLITYFLVKRIFAKSKFSEHYALSSSLFLAISPWHIMLSRAAFEANVATFFIVFAVWTFLEGVQNPTLSSGIGKRWFLILSAASFAFSIYTFNTARIVSPLLAFFLIFLFRKEIFKIKREAVFAGIVGLVLVLPIIGFLLSSQAQLRFKEVNIFTDSQIVKMANQEIANDNNAFWSKVLHNRRLLYGVEYLKHYFDNLNTSFLFTKGDGNPKFSTQNVGEMYLWDLPFFIAGILFLIKKRESYWLIIPIWLIIGLIPAGVARETPHALRTEVSLPMFQILSAYGAVLFIRLISNIKYKILNIKIKYIIFSLTFLFLIFNFLYFYYDYLKHYPIQFSGEWQYGYKQSINYVSKNQGKYQGVYVTQQLGRPYIYYLFYTQTDPEIFRKEAEIKRDAFGFVDVQKFGKYYFVRNPGTMDKQNFLYVTDKYNIPKSAKILKTVDLLDGNPSLIIYTL